MDSTKFYAGLAIVAIIAIAAGAFAYTEAHSLNAKIDSLSSASASAESLAGRVAALESRISVKPVPATIYFDSTDAFTKDVVAAAIRLGPVLENQGLKVALKDVAGNTTALRGDGFHSLPAIFISSDDLLSNPSLEQALKSQPMVTGGYAIDAMGLLTNGKTILGSECTAPNKTKLYLFTDYQCDGCNRLYYETNDALKKLANSVAFEYRQLPVAVRPQTRGASKAALCAKDQGKFDAYNKLLFENYQNLSAENLEVLAASAGLDKAKFDACTASAETDNRVEDDVTEALLSYKITSSPAFVVNCKNVFTATTSAKIIENVCLATGNCPKTTTATATPAATTSATATPAANSTAG